MQAMMFLLLGFQMMLPNERNKFKHGELIDYKKINCFRKLTMIIEYSREDRKCYFENSKFVFYNSIIAYLIKIPKLES